MKSSKIERALYGPSLFEVTLGALLSISLGVALGAVFLILKPVMVVKEKELPKEEDRVQGAVYYVEGLNDAARGRQWVRKRQLLLEGPPGEIAFYEEELNQWLSSGSPKHPAKKPATPPPAKPPAPGQKGPAQPAQADETPQELLAAETPNIRIRDGVFQVGVPASLNVMSLSLPVVVQAQGDFVKDGDVWTFNPSTLYLGSLPLHRVPGLSAKLSRWIVNANVSPDDLANVSKRVAQIAVDGKTLKVTTQ